MNVKETDLENVKKIGIYCITNLVNGKKYIGKTGYKISYYNIHKYIQNGKRYLDRYLIKFKEEKI